MSLTTPTVRYYKHIENVFWYYIRRFSRDHTAMKQQNTTLDFPVLQTGV